ncbi:MAG: LipL32 family surface lipoprotein [Bacteroidia bacterium]
MKLKESLISLIALAICISTSFAQKLDKFGADMGKKSVMGKDVRAPYTDVISYYGYVKPGGTPDEAREGKKYYYLYLWVPAAAPEIGIRMVSPVPDKMAPAETDFVSPDYKDNMTDRANYFDTWVTLERALEVTSLDQVAAKAKTSKYTSYGHDDDSGELPAQPSGSKYNSLMRVTSDVNDPLKSLVAGLYRIGFTTYKTGEVQGSFIAQVGAPVKLPGVKIAKNPEDLAK